MSEEELNLFQLSTVYMAEFCAGPAQIMRSKMIQLHPFRAPSNNRRTTVRFKASRGSEQYQVMNCSIANL
jgi:hypothetical protein